jgi:hypothetical protein
LVPVLPQGVVVIAKMEQTEISTSAEEIVVGALEVLR